MYKSCYFACLICLPVLVTGWAGTRHANAQQVDDSIFPPLEGAPTEQSVLAEPPRIPLPDRNTGIANFPSQRPNTAAVPAQTGNTPQSKTDPFAGTGFRIGTLRGTIELEQQIGHSSNVSDVPDGDAGLFSRTGGALSLTSDWRRHQLQVTGDGSYRRPFDTEQPGVLDVNTSASLRMDLRDGITVTSTLNYSAASQTFSSTAGSTGVDRNPLVHTYGASVSFERDIGMFATTLRGEISRDVYEDAELANGTVIDNGDLDDIEYGLTARLGYNLSPAITPFLEGRYAIREHDERIDRNGRIRDATITELRAGLELDRSEKLTGEIALGYVMESFDDSTLDDLSGFTVNSSLNWSPRQETMISLDLGTSTNPSVGVGPDSNSLVYNARVAVERSLTARLTATGFAGFEVETGERGNTTTEFGIGGEYHISRALSVTADVEYLDFDSELPDSDYSDLSLLLGLKWER